MPRRQVFRNIVRTATALAVLPILATLMALTPWATAAAAWPERPVRIVVGFPAGGTNDIVARLIARDLTERLGQPFIVENRPGAGGNIGADLVARAAPDGYTIALSSNGALVTNRFIYPSMPFDAEKDFTPIVLVGGIPILFVAHAKLPAADLRELVALARQGGGPFNVGSPGNGTIGHLTLAYLNMLTRTPLQHIPYKGVAPALSDLLGNTIALMVTPAVGLVEPIRSGKLKGLAVTSTKRMAELPQVPTAKELGLDMEAASLIVLNGPAGLPLAIAERLNAEVNRFIRSPEGRARLAEAGLEGAGGSRQDLVDALARDLQTWQRVVAQSGEKLTTD